MSTLEIVLIAISVTVVVMALLIMKSNKNNENKKPYSLSLIALSLVILNWIVYITVLYLTDYYIVIPGKVGNFIFMPIWFIISIISFLAAFKESRNNRSFSVLVFGLATINTIVGIVLWSMANM